MIVGIGNDIMEISRMEKELAKRDWGIRDEVFTAHEINYCSARDHSERYFAARFAAKEAVFKALGTGKRPEFKWRDVEIRSDSHGKPGLNFSGGVREAMKSLLVKKALLSLSHTACWAVALVVLEN